MNHFHSCTTIEGLAPTLGVPPQLRPACSGKGTHTPHLVFLCQTLGGHHIPLGILVIAYKNPNANYQAPYTIVAYIDPIPLPHSLAGFLPKSAYHNATRHSTLGEPKFGGFGYVTPLQFPFRPHPIDMTPARATTEPGADPNNLTNQLATILHESFGIEPKRQVWVYQKPYPDYYDQLLYPRG
jgi:hypothetical protein